MKTESQIKKIYRNFPEKRIDQCIEDMIEVMKIFKDKTHNELRIARSKTILWKPMLFSLYQEAFGQGVYTTK